jgi:hypothetical protein
MLTSHKNLIEGTESTGYTGREANEPQQKLLVLSELPDRWQQLIEIKWLLKQEQKVKK